MHFYSWIIGFGNFLKDYFLLLIRLYWGINFFLAGMAKFGNIPLVDEHFSALYIPYSHFAAYLVAFIEVVGGFCLIVGLLSRLMAIPLAIVMIVALFTAHLTETMGIFAHPQRFINQTPFNFLMACLIILCFGPGKLAIDKFLCRREKSGE